MTNKFNTKARMALNNIKPYTPGKPIEEVKRELGIDDVIKLASNENPLGPSKKAVEKMKDAIEKVNLYPDGTCFYLKQEIAASKGVKPSQVIVGNGSDEIIKLLAEAFIEPGDNAIMADPSFSEYDFAVSLMGGFLKKIPLTDTFKHDLDAMSAAIDEKTKLIFICNPNNPTGTIVTKQEIDAFLDRVPENVVVIFDEAYHEYAVSDEYPHGLDYVKAGWENVAVMYTFSKIYGLAGLRIGYTIADEALLSWVYRAREPFNVNSVAQAAALGAIHDNEHVEMSRKVNLEGAAYIYGELSDMGLDYVETNTNFIWINVKQDDRVVFDKMLQKGVIIRTGNVFGYPNYIRVTVGTMDENKRFIKALKEVL